MDLANSSNSQLLACSCGWAVSEQIWCVQSLRPPPLQLISVVGISMVCKHCTLVSYILWVDADEFSLCRYLTVGKLEIFDAQGLGINQCYPVQIIDNGGPISRLNQTESFSLCFAVNHLSLLPVFLAFLCPPLPITYVYRVDTKFWY